MQQANPDATFATPVVAEPAWAAVFSLSMGVFGLVTAEFLPASLLTPMAQSFGLSPAVVGQSVTVTALAALVSGLLVSVLTRGIDRGVVLMAFSALLVGSNLMVALSPNLAVLLVARVILGVALGGFWSMAAAVAMRLVPSALVPRALSVVFSAVSVATIVAVPVGSLLGSLYGWRSAFVLDAVIGVATLAMQAGYLPRLPSHGAARLQTLAEVMLRPGIGLGLICSVLVLGGHFALFTYIRPYLEEVAGLGVDGMALMLLGFGVANFAGTLAAGFLLERNLRLTLAVMPLVIGCAGLALAGLHLGVSVSAVLFALWGMAFGMVPVGWSTWVARAVPDEAESAGGLLVASIQFAIAAGAAAGGLIFGLAGIVGVFAAGGALLSLTSGVIFTRVARGVAA